MTSMDSTAYSKKIYKKYNINTETKLFNKYYNAGLLDKIDEDFLVEVNNYWDTNYGRKIDPVLNLAFYNLTGKRNPRIMPGRVMWYQIIPYFNDMNIRIGYSDKNIYDQLIGTVNTPKTILKRVRGHYFNSENVELSPQNAYQLLLESQCDMIIKPSDTDNGKGIKKIKFDNYQLYLDGSIITVNDLENYGYNFIIQEVIQQHEIMAKPHPASVNTLRMVTLRWKNEIKYLLTFARFGTNNSVKDNAGTGGLCIGINDDGEFLDFAIDEFCNVYTSHPTTNYNFKEYAKIPEFDKYKNFVIDLHKNILHHDFVSWDIAVGVNNEPIFIEANYRGATWLYQLAAQRPLFGELTEEILQHVSKELQQKSDRNVRSTLTNKNKKLRRKNLELQSELEKLKNNNLKLQTIVGKLSNQEKQIENEIGLLKKENQYLKSRMNYIENSKSWKYTAFLRKIVKNLK